MSFLDISVLIVGHGAMAQELQHECVREKVPCSVFPETGNKPDVAIHLGSGREFPQLLEFCASGETRIPILECSSIGVVEGYTPVPIIQVPNAALPVLFFLMALGDFAERVHERFGGQEYWQLFESHQTSKKGTSATARHIAELMRIPNERLQIDRSNPRPRAYHKLTGRADGVHFDLSFEIEGRTPYAPGMLYLARCAKQVSRRILPRTYKVKDFLNLL
jgi:hypothetical protein